MDLAMEYLSKRIKQAENDTLVVAKDIRVIDISEPQSLEVKRFKVHNCERCGATKSVSYLGTKEKINAPF